MNEDNILDVEQPVSNDNVISEPDSTNTPISVEETENEPILEESTTETEEGAADPEAEQSEADGSASTDVVTEVVYENPLEEYSLDNPLPVMVIEEEVEEEPIQAYSLTGTYAGTISDTYLDYFEGIVEKLKPSEHYVIYRTGQYAYNLCYGEEIELNGTFFSGECEVVSLYRDDSNYNNTWYVDKFTDSLALSATDIFAYSDLGMYPTVERGMTNAESTGLLIAVAVATVFMLASRIFDYIVEHIYRK